MKDECILVGLRTEQLPILTVRGQETNEKKKKEEGGILLCVEQTSMSALSQFIQQAIKVTGFQDIMYS